MHNGGVVQTLLYAQGQRQGAVKVGDPDDRQHRHQLLAGHPGVVRLHLGYQQARGARRNGETRRRQQRSRAFTDQFFIRRAVGQADGTQGIGLLSAQQQRVKILHLLDQAVSDGGDDDQAFFGDTGQVVIEGGAADNIFGGFDEIGGFINDARRIAGASADHFFTAFHAHRHANRRRHHLRADVRPPAALRVDQRFFHSLTGGAMHTFSLQTRLYSGPGSLAALQRFSHQHIWIVCDGFLARSPLLDRLRAALPASNRVSVFSDITPDPTIHTVAKGIAQMQALRPQVVIGFGGGSAMDAAKAIVWFSQQGGLPVDTCVAIPTTSGTGSEVTSACVISDPEKGIKYPLFHEALCPDMAIIDPTLVVSVPPTITAHTGLDALTHALEAWVSPQATDFTDALAEKAVRLVFRALPVAIRQGDCIATRSKMHNASTLAGMAFSQAGLGLNHAIAHQLGGQFHLPHGLANALLLTAVIRFNAGEPRAAKRYARLARACRFCPPEAGEQEAFQALLTAVETLKQQCAIPTLKGALQEKYPLFLSRIPAMVPAALADATLRTNPRPVDGAAIAQLLESLQ